MNLSAKVASAAVVLVALAGCGDPQFDPDRVRLTTPPTPLPTVKQTIEQEVTACVLGEGGKADRRCDPGITNSLVTQENIGQTICKPGWTDEVRPPTSYTSPRRDLEMLRYYHPGHPSNLVRYDHLVPLELGGATHDVRNLWPQPVAASYRKNTEGGQLKDRVCARTMSLIEAQQTIVEHWTH